MRISGEQSNIAANIGPLRGVSAAASASSHGHSSSASTIETSAATVSFSSRAQEISRATSAVNSSPDTRDDLVASLKSKVDSGTYHVSSSDIAEMMYRRHAADNVK
jgi:negative regulator of flagellin synthesis FlgM